MTKPKLICPSCGAALRRVLVEGIAVDVCRDGCGGMWLDRFELPLMDEPHELSDENLLDLLAIDSGETVTTHRRMCPKCVEPVMMQGFYSGTVQVTVDRCPRCFGWWLDEAELLQIRQEAEPRTHDVTRAASNPVVRLLNRLLSALFPRG